MEKQIEGQEKGVAEEVISSSWQRATQKLRGAEKKKKWSSKKWTQ